MGYASAEDGLGAGERIKQPVAVVDGGAGLPTGQLGVLLEYREAGDGGARSPAQTGSGPRTFRPAPGTVGVQSPAGRFSFVGKRS